MASLPHKWLDKRVSDLPLECFKEAGRCLSDKVGPNYEDLASRVDLCSSLSKAKLMQSDNPGLEVLERYKQLPNSTVIALIHILEQLKRHDVIRIIHQYINDPFSFTLMLREEHDKTVIDYYNIKSFAGESLKEAIQSHEEMRKFSFNKLHYVGETPIPENIASPKVMTSLFKGRQVSMETCTCKAPVQETFRPRLPTVGGEGARPKHKTPPRNALSAIPERGFYQPLQVGPEQEFQRPGDTFGSTLPRKVSGSQRLVVPQVKQQRDSTLSVDSALPDSPRGSCEIPDNEAMYDDTESAMGRPGIHVQGRDSGVDMDTDRDLSLHLKSTAISSGTNDTYLTTTEFSEENLYENVEPPGFHGDVKQNSQIERVLQPYKHLDNFYITRRSSSNPETARSISITFRREIWNYRITVTESELRSGQPHYSYHLYEETGPFFPSMDALFDHYRTHPIAPEGKSDGPYLKHPIEPRP